jgi:hypothetical protein
MPHASTERLKAVFSSLTSSYQQAMDSILNYPLYYAIVQGFTIPGPGNMSDVSTVMGQIQSSFKVCHIHLAVALTNLSR